MENYLSTVIFSAGILQGLLLIIVLVRKESLKSPCIILILFIFVITLQVIIKFQEIYSHHSITSNFYSVLYYLPYLYGPLTYLYTRKTFNSSFKLKLRHTIHLLPFMLVISVLVLLDLNINIFHYVDNDVYNITDTLLQLIILSAYIMASKKILKSGGLHNDEALRRWISRFSTVVWLSGSALIILFTLIFYNIELLTVQFRSAGFLLFILPALLYWIGYNTLFKPLAVTPQANTNGTVPVIRYQNNRLGAGEIRNIFNRVDTCLKSQKMYLEQDLTLEMLSKSVNISKHHISQAVNISLGKNFNDYINSNRIEHAKAMLSNPSKQHITIAAIAMESGFNSISTFNEAFKKTVGVPPSAYRKQNVKR